MRTSFTCILKTITLHGTAYETNQLWFIRFIVFYCIDKTCQHQAKFQIENNFYNHETGCNLLLKKYIWTRKILQILPITLATSLSPSKRWRDFQGRCFASRKCRKEIQNKLPESVVLETSVKPSLGAKMAAKVSFVRRYNNHWPVTRVVCTHYNHLTGWQALDNYEDWLSRKVTSL